MTKNDLLEYAKALGLHVKKTLDDGQRMSIIADSYGPSMLADLDAQVFAPLTPVTFTQSMLRHFDDVGSYPIVFGRVPVREVWRLNHGVRVYFSSHLITHQGDRPQVRIWRVKIFRRGVRYHGPARPAAHRALRRLRHHRRSQVRRAQRDAMDFTRRPIGAVPMTKKAEPLLPKVKQVATHVMVTVEMRSALRSLSSNVRCHQSVLLRDAVGDLLKKYESPRPSAMVAARDGWRDADRSIVFRLKPAMLSAVQLLARRTRIRQSELLREAIGDLLRGVP